MIKIRSYIMKSVMDAIPTGKYIINTDSTMGRLVKKMLDKHHVGHEAFDDAVHVVMMDKDDNELDQIIIEQIESLYRQNRKPVKILMGAVDYREFQCWIHEVHGHWESRVGRMYEDRSQPDGYRREIYIMGLPVTIVPTMDGILVLDEEMMTTTF